MKLTELVLCLFELVPIDTELLDRRAYSTRFEILRPPIRDDGRLAGTRVVPFAMRTAGASWKLLAAEVLQLLFDLPTSHDVDARCSK